MDRFGAKRHAIRSALAGLEKAGLVIRPPNKGAHVRGYSPDEVRALYDFRTDLHAIAVERMPLPFPNAVLGSLEEIVARHESAVAQRDLAAVIRENNRFHDVLFSQCGNLFLATTIQRMDVAANAIRSYRIGNSDMLRVAMQEHRDIVAAARAGDRARLADLCRQHIMPSRDLYLHEQSWWVRQHRQFGARS